MLARYTHPTEERKLGALALPAVVTNWSQTTKAAGKDIQAAQEIVDLLRKFGGRQEDRTPDLRVANAALSQLS